MRWGIFVHDPDGDSGYGRIVGPYRAPETADRKADSIIKMAEASGVLIECIILPIAPGQTSTRDIVSAIAEP